AWRSRGHGDGVVILGDSAGFVDVPSLKGIHYAVQSGIYAARAIFAALKEGDVSAAQLAAYDRMVDESFIARDLYQRRNMRLAFRSGFYVGGAKAALMTLTGGRFPGGRIRTPTDAAVPRRPGGATQFVPDGKLTFSKVDAVYKSGNATRDTIPSHLIIGEDVPPEIAELYECMCPAGVYERQDGKLVVNAPNCIDCKATDVLGPRWTPRESGSGPQYRRMCGRCSPAAGPAAGMPRCRRSVVVMPVSTRRAGLSVAVGRIAEQLPIQQVVRMAAVHAGPGRVAGRDDHAAERAHRAVRDRLAGRVLVDRGEAVHVVLADRHAEARSEQASRHADHVAVLVQLGRRLPQQLARGHVLEAQRDAVLVQVPAHAEDAAGDGGPPLPALLRAPRRQVVRVLARGRHYVHVEREHRDRREPRPARRVRHARHDPDPLVRLGRRVVHHRVDEQPLAFVH